MTVEKMQVNVCGIFSDYKHPEKLIVFEDLTTSIVNVNCLDCEGQETLQ